MICPAVVDVDIYDDGEQRTSLPKIDSYNLTLSTSDWNYEVSMFPSTFDFTLGDYCDKKNVSSGSWPLT